jgi:hypothetical protein
MRLINRIMPQRLIALILVPRLPSDLKMKIKSTLTAFRRVLIVVLFCLLVISSGCGSISTGPDQSTQNASDNKDINNVSPEDHTSKLESTSNKTESESYVSRTEKIEVFAQSYTTFLEEGQNINISNYSIDKRSGSLNITYVVNETHVVEEDVRLALSYAAHVNDYRGNTFSTVNRSYIPRKVNYHSTLESNQGVFSNRYVNLTMANKYNNNEWNRTKYLLNFFDTLRYGPAANSSEVPS